MICEEVVLYITRTHTRIKFTEMHVIVPTAKLLHAVNCAFT